MERDTASHNRNYRIAVLGFPILAQGPAAAVVAQLVERPQIRPLKDVQLSDVNSNPSYGIRW